MCRRQLAASLEGLGKSWDRAAFPPRRFMPAGAREEGGASCGPRRKMQQVFPRCAPGFSATLFRGRTPGFAPGASLSARPLARTSVKSALLVRDEMTLLREARKLRWFFNVGLRRPGALRQKRARVPSKGGFNNSFVRMRGRTSKCRNFARNPFIVALHLTIF